MAEADVAHNKNVGFFIDYDFYTEEQFKKLPEEMMIALGKKGSYGVMADPDFERLKKDGYVTDGGKYQPVFFLFLKTESTIFETLRRERHDAIEKAKRNGALKIPVVKSSVDKLVINSANSVSRTSASAADSTYHDKHAI